MLLLEFQNHPLDPFTLLLTIPRWLPRTLRTKLRLFHSAQNPLLIRPSDPFLASSEMLPHTLFQPNSALGSPKSKTLSHPLPCSLPAMTFLLLLSLLKNPANHTHLLHLISSMTDARDSSWTSQSDLQSTFCVCPHRSPQSCSGGLGVCWATSHPSEYRPGGYRTVLTPLRLARKEGPEALAEWMMVVRVRLC